ncbi:MAG: helix-turn-helix transcriptional regulator [Ginsengibacter sp.]
MTRKELIKSEEYWTAQIQIDLFELIENYRKNNNLNKTQLAAQLGVTKSYVTQVLNGNFDHKVSKLVELSLAFGKVPVLQFIDVDKYIEKDHLTQLKGSSGTSNPPKLKKTFPKSANNNTHRSVGKIKLRKLTIDK